MTNPGDSWPPTPQTSSNTSPQDRFGNPEDLLGTWAEAGEIPDDPEPLDPLVEGICYKNARDYFGFDGLGVKHKGIESETKENRK